MPDLPTYVATLGALEMVGVVGFVVYIGAFGSVQLGLLDGNSSAYSCANILAATLVAISLLAEFNLASALIQGSWIIIGLTGLAIRHAKSERPQHPPIQTPTQFGAKS